MLRPWNLNLAFDPRQKKPGVPMYQALADELRRIIEAGVLRPGDALPGSRELAEQFGISRKTVVTAMKCLTDLGLLEQRPRVGLFVPCPPKESDSCCPECGGQAACCPPRLVINDGQPDSQLMPSTELGRAYRLLLGRAARRKQLDKADPRGLLKLREAIASALCHSRRLLVDADEVLITHGSLQSIYLAAHALLRPGDAIGIERLAHPFIRQVFLSAGLRVVDLPVDHHGLCVDQLATRLHASQGGQRLQGAFASLSDELPPLKAIYVTPHFNYPNTSTLPPERCQMLADLARRYNLLVIEDDFDSLVSRVGHLRSPLSGLLPKDNYLYMLSGTRLLAATVRIGYVAGSRSHIDAMTAHRRIMDGNGDPILEHALLHLIEQGVISRHLRHVAKVYDERLDYISARIRHELHGRVRYERPEGGLALWLEMHADPTADLCAMGIQAHAIDLGDGLYGLRVGYASMSNDEMDLLISSLSKVLPAF